MGAGRKNTRRDTRHVQYRERLYRRGGETHPGGKRVVPEGHLGLRVLGHDDCGERSCVPGSGLAAVAAHSSRLSGELRILGVYVHDLSPYVAQLGEWRMAYALPLRLVHPRINYLMPMRLGLSSH